MKNGQTRFIVATNVAARGLDIPNVEMIIQCSPPKESEYYIHRAGRTGRAGKQGLCFILYDSEE
jgi:superfamily II DNA/RNA helicase